MHYNSEALPLLIVLFFIFLLLLDWMDSSDMKRRRNKK